MDRQTAHRPMLGIAQIVGGAALITFNDICMKQVMVELGVGQAVFLRGLVVMILMTGVFAWQGKLRRALRVADWRAQLWTAFLGSLTLVFFVGSLPFLPLSTAILLAYTSPLILASIAPRMLGERPGKVVWIAALIGLAGTATVLRPGGSDFSWALLMPLAAAVAVAWRDVWTRRLVETETSESLFTFVIVSAMLVGAVVAPFDWAPVSGRNAIILLVASVFLAFGILISIEAFRWAPASVLGPFKYTAIPWAVAADAFFWGKVPDHWTFVGGGLIVLGGLIVVRAQRRSA